MDPELILQLVSYHQRVFGGGIVPTAFGAIGTLTSSAGSVVTGQGIGASAKDGSKGRKKGRGRDEKKVATSEATPERDNAWRLREAQREATAAVKRAHDLAGELLPSVAPLLPASLDTEARGAQLAMTCWTYQRVQGRALDITGGGEQMTREVFAEENNEEAGRLRV